MQKWVFGLLAVLAPIQGASAGARDAVYLSERGTLTDGHGVFLGVSVRLAGKSHFRAREAVSFKLAGTSRNSSSRELAIGEGLELGFSAGRRLQLSLGGKPISDIKGRRNNLSTLGAVGIGVAALAVVGGIFLLGEIHDYRQYANSD